MSTVPSSSEFQDFCRHALLTLIGILWTLILPIHHSLRAIYRLCSQASDTAFHASPGIAAGKTVLITTGRQAKTLHTVRALKKIGAKVIVADYDVVSASAVSVSADGFILLPSLSDTAPKKWLSYFEAVLSSYKIDVILPVSTINEVLMMGLAKSTLAERFPNVTWLCPDLSESLQLDDRHQFSALCDQYEVPKPDSGILTSLKDIDSIAGKYRHGLILKRIESSVNRLQEIVPYKKGDELPGFVSPSENDKWQWQQFVKGAEKSAWYISIHGKATLSGCYFSEADLTQFDPAPVPEELDAAVKRLLQGMNLTGQFAFDFIEDCTTGSPNVIECNPRASSVLETISATPRWGEAFFGVAITNDIIHRSVGFLFHQNCWPWASRTDGHFQWSDPLPFFVAQFVWPLYAIASKGMTKLSFEKIDVNICKIIISGPSPSRNLQVFREFLKSPLKMPAAKD